VDAQLSANVERTATTIGLALREEASSHLFPNAPDHLGDAIPHLFRVELNQIRTTKLIAMAKINRLPMRPLCGSSGKPINHRGAL